MMSALALRSIACIAMLIDHIGYMFSFMPFRMIGRIAFPIFLYLILNGYRHTSSRLRYALRLGLFALLSQIPFTLFCYGRLWYPKGNVFFTLLMALLCIWSADAMGKHRLLRWVSLLPSIVVALLYHRGIMDSDYGARAILLAMVFYLFDGKGVAGRVLMVLGMLCSVQYVFLLSACKQLGYFLLGMQAHIPTIDRWALVQSWSLAALPLIFAYNGKKGRLPERKLPAKLIQYGFYVFYPAHQLVLWAVERVLL